MTLGGHEAEIPGLCQRVDEISHFHQLRLEKVLDICAEPQTILDVSKASSAKSRAKGFGKSAVIGAGSTLLAGSADAGFKFGQATGRF